MSRWPAALRQRGLCAKMEGGQARRVCGIQKSQISSVPLICMGTRGVHLFQCQFYIWEPVQVPSYKFLNQNILRPFIWAVPSYALGTPHPRPPPPTHTHTHIC